MAAENQSRRVDLTSAARKDLVVPLRSGGIRPPDTDISASAGSRPAVRAQIVRGSAFGLPMVREQLYRLAGGVLLPLRNRTQTSQMRSLLDLRQEWRLIWDFHFA